MKFSVSQKVFSITIASAIVLGFILLGVYRQFAILRTTNDRVLELGMALKAQQDSDQMHDALRGDAIGAILASRSKDAATLAQTEKDYADHVTAFRAGMGENARRDLGTDANGKIQGPRRADRKILQGRRRDHRPVPQERGRSRGLQHALAGILPRNGSRPWAP